MSMTCVSYTELRQNLSRYLDEAASSRAPIIVTRQNGRGNVVLIAEEEFEGWRETVHLLADPRNAERLRAGIREFEAGGGQERELIIPRE